MIWPVRGSIATSQPTNLHKPRPNLKKNPVYTKLIQLIHTGKVTNADKCQCLPMVRDDWKGHHANETPDHLPRNIKGTAGFLLSVDGKLLHQMGCLTWGPQGQWGWHICGFPKARPDPFLDASSSTHNGTTRIIRCISLTLSWRSTVHIIHRQVSTTSFLGRCLEFLTGPVTVTWRCAHLKWHIQTYYNCHGMMLCDGSDILGFWYHSTISYSIFT